MATGQRNGGMIDAGANSPDFLVESFKKAVIERLRIFADQKQWTDAEYGMLSEEKGRQSGNAAHAVERQFTRYTVEWLGFHPADWVYYQPQTGEGKNPQCPAYLVSGSPGVAFMVGDTESTCDCDRNEHLRQLGRSWSDPAGYAVWCNMRRILAVRCMPEHTGTYETLVDLSVENLCGPPQLFAADEQALHMTQLLVFHLLFCKDRLTQFQRFAERIRVDEQTFEHTPGPLTTPQAIRHFIEGSRQPLDHIRLAALARIREARVRQTGLGDQEILLRREWDEAKEALVQRMRSPLISEPVARAIEQLTPRLGALTQGEIDGIGKILADASPPVRGGQGSSATFSTLSASWQESAGRINSALLAQRCKAARSARMTAAYQVWSERQSDPEDRRLDVFAEQVAYVFFVRLLLLRVLEDKHILYPRIARDGGLPAWSACLARSCEERKGAAALNEPLSAMLARKASSYALHFFSQAVFDWFTPDEFFFAETLEFLYKYNFQDITNDILGFTYEAYIDRNARNRQGHFLTRETVVEYMLDLLEYTGPRVVGRRIFDPACGSGSFLVHAARRYRRGLLSALCSEKGLPEGELRQELARRYVNDLPTRFFGMELNPFACYLAEMNLLLQALDDLAVLQQAGAMQSIERFSIYTADSLHVPHEEGDGAEVNKEFSSIRLPDRPGAGVVADVRPVQAGLETCHDGFFYIISNPPYVSRKQEKFDTARFRAAAFYRAILSGDMNLYLLFLRLGLYYLADSGRMIYLVPLTIFGDKSSGAARKLLKTPPFRPSVAIRFYRGDLLFPGVDQSVAIVRIDHSSSQQTMLIGGGNTVREAEASQFLLPLVDVIDATPQSRVWYGNWLIAPDRRSWSVWQHVKRISGGLTTLFEGLLDTTFARKQGDVNATYLNPLRVGHTGFSQGHVAIYKGEDIRAFAPLAEVPSDWARPLPPHGEQGMPGKTVRVSRTLQGLQHLPESEQGIVLREVARLNTRERLIATWFERSAAQPVAFTHKLWRMILKDPGAETYGKALLAVMNSKTIAYLLNLFSTNNDVSKDDIGRVPVPDPKTLPAARLARLADDALAQCAQLYRDVVVKYGARLPACEDGEVYVAPSRVLAVTPVPAVSLSVLVGRGAVRNRGAAGGRIRTLRTQECIVCATDAGGSERAAFAAVLDIFLAESEREHETWMQAQSWQVPDSVAAGNWLKHYQDARRQAQQSWRRFLSIQYDIDEAVADWYGFDTAQRRAIDEGLPWARRRREKLQDMGE